MEPKPAALLLVQNALLRMREFIDESATQLRKSMADVKEDLARDLRSVDEDKPKNG